MEYTSIQEAMDKGSGEVRVHGWVHRERGSNKLRFIVLRDNTNNIQCVISKGDVGDEKFAVADKLQVECSMEITGEIKKDERAPTGYEILVKDFNVVGWSDSWPIQPGQSREFIDDNRHLYLRSSRMTAILKIRSTIFGALHGYFRSKGFYEYQSPIFQGMQCEGGSTLFECNYFGKPIYLAQTWQLYGEPAIFALGNTYTMAPSFRAEKSKTSRHLTEYWHCEMELAWNTFEDLQDHAEAMLKYVLSEVLLKNARELQILKRDLSKLTPTTEKDFPRITYTEALKLLDEKCGMKIEWGKDLRTIEEDQLSELFDTPVIVTEYPKVVKAFYMREVPEDHKVVQGFDVIGPEGYGEIIGASQREESIEKLKENLVAQGEDPAEYGFYFDTRKYGSIPHGGYGLGVERLVTWICGLDNIKDSIPFPRTMMRWKP